MADDVGKIFRNKADRRQSLAALPFEEKIRILVRLQRIAQEIKKDRRRPVWPIDTS
jgi:hypothetical protein